MDWSMKSFLAGIVAGSGLYASYKWIVPRRNEVEQNECVFFAPFSCPLDCLKNPNQCDSISCTPCSLHIIRKALKETKTHLDICVYLWTLEEITRDIIKLFRAGVFVRILMDRQMSLEASNTKVLVFLKNHIPFKLVDCAGIMHNKFAIIDQKKVITGSFNWTAQALRGNNFENGVIINDKHIADKYNKYFESIWASVPNSNLAD